ncbi:uncharacterized protein [Parasteatoda tepidariorum]|uniref:uncharacterized protein n=1 Tax=Parasteatoda tepidariorum TaxID=114398 RepID=UPI0039BCBDB1
MDDIQNVVIFVDSISEIQTVTSVDFSDSLGIKSCKENFGLLLSLKKNILLQWIPSHCNIYGNEMADLLAKKGTGILQRFQSEIPYSSINRINKNAIIKSHENNFNEQIGGQVWRETLNRTPDHLRRITVAAFRLETGHDFLAAHLHRLNIFPDPNCVLCGKDSPMNIEHLGVYPAVTGNIYDRYRRGILMEN